MALQLQPPPPAASRDPVTLGDRPGPVTPERPSAAGAPSQAQPLLRPEAQVEEEEEEGEETGVQGARGPGTAEQRRRGWGEAEEGRAEAWGAGAAGSGSPAGGGGRLPQCCPCAAPLARAAARCCHGGTKMAALAYNLGKREINHYFSVRSAKVLALAAVVLLAACHLASRRYRGERCSPCPGRPGRRRRCAGGRPLARHTPTLAASARPGPTFLARGGCVPTCPCCPRAAERTRARGRDPPVAPAGSPVLRLSGPGSRAGGRARSRGRPGRCSSRSRAALRRRVRPDSRRGVLPLPGNRWARLLDSGKSCPCVRAATRSSLLEVPPPARPSGCSGTGSQGLGCTLFQQRKYRPLIAAEKLEVDRSSHGLQEQGGSSLKADLH